MGDSFTEPASVGHDIIRLLFATLDRPAYWLLGLVYELFFNVASADLFSNNTIMKFYGRVQIILGVFMMFHLSMAILKGIVNPDTFTGDKGAKALMTRIFTALILIIALMPISIPSAKNEYERQINNNGLLFGTLYSLQHRILANNTLGRLILGTTDSSPSFQATPSGNDSELKKSARIFTSTILKGFYRINLVPEDQRVSCDKDDPAACNENRVCTNIDDDILEEYTRLDADPNNIISMVTLTCDSDIHAGFLGSLLNGAWTAIQKLTGTTKYVFAYMPFISMIVPIVFVFILLSFTIDVAVRAVKLAVLRLLAPIPIISYMDPNGSNDSAFNSWVKTLSSTYLDLFIRLAVVYFVIFLIQDMIINGIVIDVGTGVIGVISLIIVWIGLFIFARQAPKFIKQALGLKDSKFKLFSGFSELAAAASVGAGIVGGAVSRGSASYQKDGNMGKAMLNGIVGGIGGGRNAGKTYFSNPESNATTIMNNNRSYQDHQRRVVGSDGNALGAFKARAQGMFGMQNDQQRMDNKINDYNSAAAAWKRADGAMNSDSKNTSYGGPTVTAGGGRETIFQSGGNYSAKEANDIVSRMKSSGQYTQAEIEAAEEASKSIRSQRFKEIRDQAHFRGRSSLSATEAQVYDAGQIVYEVGVKYRADSDGVFGDFRQASAGGYETSPIGMGNFKGAAYGAERQADAIKNSPDYAKAAANAQRASEKNNK